MKTSWVVGSVVAVHCVVVGGIMLTPGCGTTRPVTSTPPEDVQMPAVESPATATKASIPPARRAPVDEPTRSYLPISKPAVKSWSADTTPYTIQSGDSISGIAKRYHLSQAEILALNHISNPNKIRAGQKIQLPGKVNVVYAPAPKKASAPKAAKKDSTATSAKSSTPAVAGPGEYLVKSGDTLGAIAVAHKTTVKALKEVNNLQSDRLKINQKLKIPGQAGATVTPELPVAPVIDAAPITSLPGETGAVSSVVAPVDASGTNAVVAPAPVSGAPAAQPTMKTITVGAGEDLYSIAMVWEVSVTELQRINGLTGTDLTPGQTLKIPSVE